MRARSSALVALVALTVLTLFVGAGASAPTDDAGDGPGVSDGTGPPGELPGPVPDSVGNTLDLIWQFLNGLPDGAPGPTVNDEAGSANGG